MTILVGDIGGTHTRLALAQVTGRDVTLGDVARYQNAEYADLSEIIAGFLSGSATPAVCCLAIAGPITGPADAQTARMTNLAWQVDASALAHRFGLAHVRLINDFTAVGWGLNSLRATEIDPLQAGKMTPGSPRLALGAGTGLGVSLCPWQGDHYHPIPSEGGHIGFAPTDPEQDRLLAYLRAMHGRVSLERILSGPGLIALYHFRLHDLGSNTGSIASPLATAEAISQAGLRQDDPHAVQALRLFARIYGQTAGDLALATRAEGGVFLAGGIAAKILPALKAGDFLEGFHHKGRYSSWMATLPVSVLLDPDIGLKGAATAAVHQ